MAPRSRSIALPLARARAAFQRAADEERRRLAHALHDSALQTLTAAAMNLALVERELAALSTQGRKALTDAQALVETCGRELRTLSHALFPEVLSTAGLSPALRWLARQQGPDRLTLELSRLPRYGRSVELAAFRLVEEALSSYYAERAPVRVQAAPLSSDRLSITLDGRPRRTKGPGAGVLLRARLQAIGGRARSRLAPGSLRIQVSFPPSVPDGEG
jgi:signal transduction histidine kinase